MQYISGLDCQSQKLRTSCGNIYFKEEYPSLSYPSTSSCISAENTMWLINAYRNLGFLQMKGSDS